MLDTIPTRIAALLYIVFLVLVILIISLDTSYWSVLLVIIICSIPYTMITLYDIDCIFDGHCTVWGWIKGILYILYILLTIILIIILLANFKKYTESSSLNVYSEK
jgi:hypothetical protein